MDMAFRIKERRKAMNLTQEELALKLGLQKSAIAKYENGRVENIKRSVILRMAIVLECKPSYLLGFDETVEDSFSLSSTEKDIIIAYRQVDEGRREAVRVLLGVETMEEKSGTSAS